VEDLNSLIDDTIKSTKKKVSKSSTNVSTLKNNSDSTVITHSVQSQTIHTNIQTNTNNPDKPQPQPQPKPKDEIDDIVNNVLTEKKRKDLQNSVAKSNSDSNLTNQLYKHAD